MNKSRAEWDTVSVAMVMLLVVCVILSLFR